MFAVPDMTGWSFESPWADRQHRFRKIGRRRDPGRFRRADHRRRPAGAPTISGRYADVSSRNRPVRGKGRGRWRDRPRRAWRRRFRQRSRHGRPRGDRSSGCCGEDWKTARTTGQRSGNGDRGDKARGKPNGRPGRRAMDRNRVSASAFETACGSSRSRIWRGRNACGLSVVHRGEVSSVRRAASRSAGRADRQRRRSRHNSKCGAQGLAGVYRTGRPLAAR